MTLDRIAEHHGTQATDAERTSFGGSVGSWPAFADSADALARLKERFQLIILSNVDRASFAASNERLGVEFDLVVTAEDVGAYKPSPQNFTALLDAIGTIGVDQGPVAPRRPVAVPRPRAGQPRSGSPRSGSTGATTRTASGPRPHRAGAVTPTWQFPSMATFAEAATSGA